MGLFGPGRDERLAAAAAALAPYGFAFDARYAERVKQYFPSREFYAPEHCVTACSGAIEDARVEAYEYQSSSTDAEGNTSWSTTTLVAVQHPGVPGGAAFRPDPREWGGVGAAIEALLWVPPFTILKAFQLYSESRDPDRIVGDAEFDRLYRVRAESDAHAARAIPPGLRRAALDLRFRGGVELRPGLLLYAPSEYALDGDTAVSAVGVATVFLGALRGRLGAHPMR